MDKRLLFLPLLVVAFTTGVFGCGGSEPDSSAWQRVADLPLSARENTVGVWTGERIVLVGGSDARPCPANADCITPGKPPLRDGVSFDPESGNWTPIESAPVGFSGAEGVAMDGRVYIWSLGESGRPGAPRVFLAYDPAEDHWIRLPQPPVKTYSAIIAAGDRIIAFSLSDEGGTRPDFAYDPSAGKWKRLPDDPLPPSFDRTMVWSGSELILLGKELDVEYKTSDPTLLKAAAFNPGTGEWRRLPAPDTLDQYATDVRWFRADGLLINPAPGESHGTGGSWERSFRDGGIFDPAKDQWLDLPEAPDGVEEFAGLFGAGIVAGVESHYFGYRGWVLDPDAKAWIEIPRLDRSGTEVSGRTVVAAGEEMIVFGGVRFGRDSGGLLEQDGKLLDQAWIWSPR